jgi:hypothetical protein
MKFFGVARTGGGLELNRPFGRPWIEGITQRIGPARNRLAGLSEWDAAQHLVVNSHMN